MKFSSLFGKSDVAQQRPLNKRERLARLFPDAIRETQMNYLVNWGRRCKVIYFETPKVGCTTIKRLLQEAEVGDQVSLLPERIHEKKNSPLASPFDDMDAFEAAYRSPDVLKVTFVRNPYTRALSCYLEKIAKTGDQHNRRENLALPDDREISFLEYLEAVQAQPLSEMDIHWAPQHALTMPDQVPYDMIGRLEHMKPFLERLASFAGLPEQDLSHYRKGRHATGADQVVRQNYCAETKALVDAIYAKDFAAFGYPKSLAAL